MNSSPFSYERNGLCSLIRGTKGNAPNISSSRLGCVAAVMAIVSPSQPSPAVIHNTSISVMALMQRQAPLRQTNTGDGGRCAGLYRIAECPVVTFFVLKQGSGLPEVIRPTDGHVRLQRNSDDALKWRGKCDIGWIGKNFRRLAGVTVGNQKFRRQDHATIKKWLEHGTPELRKRCADASEVCRGSANSRKNPERVSVLSGLRLQVSGSSKRGNCGV